MLIPARATRAVPVCVLALWSFAASPGWASESALAETLYQDGRKLMAQGRAVEACVKFEESLRLEQATGTLLNLAVCHETIGKLATAWAEFRAAAAVAQHDRRDDRIRLARTHLQRIEPRLSRLTITVSDQARVAGLRITLDGTVLGQAAWNVATPIDPGDHILAAAAPGHLPMSRPVVVGTTAARLAVDVKLVAATENPPQAASPPSARAPGTTVERTDAIQEPAAGLRLASYAVAGVGVAALTVGALFGARAFSRWDQRNLACPNENCNDAGVRYGGQAQDAALVANVAVGVGVVSLAVGSYLFYRAYTGRRAAPTPGGVTSAQNPPRSPRLAISPWGMALGWNW